MTTTNWYNNIWFVRLKVLIVSAFFAAIGNWIFTTKLEAPVTPFEAAPAMVAMIVLVLISMVVQTVFEKTFPKLLKMPTALYLTILATIIGSDISPVQGWIVENISKVQLMALCTPILAYAGIAIGKDLDEFKKQGVKIVIVSILTFIGTFVASALIAEICLKATGAI